MELLAYKQITKINFQINAFRFLYLLIAKYSFSPINPIKQFFLHTIIPNIRFLSIPLKLTEKQFIKQSHNIILERNKGMNMQAIFNCCQVFR